MRLDKIIAMIFLFMVASSVASMFCFLRMDETVKSLDQYGVKVSSQWSGPYSKLTMLAFVLFLINIAAASYGLFFKRRAEPELTNLEAEIDQRFEKTEKVTCGKKARLGSSVRVRDKQTVAGLEQSNEPPATKEKVIDRLEKGIKGLFTSARANDPPLVSDKEQKAESDIESIKELALSLDEIENSGETPEGKQPIPQDMLSNEQKLDKNTASVFTCSKCSRAFSKPMFVLDFGSGEARLIIVCPYCRHPYERKTSSEKR
jgi:DNA-directed RNA polymerase subunit RPC12/RpoP